MSDRKEKRNRIRFLLASAIILVVGVSLMNSQTTMNFQESDPLTGLSRSSQLSAYNNTLIYETIGNPDYLDPHVDYESFGSWITYNIYETLYTYPWDSAVTDPSVPLLAASMPVLSADGLNYTITLRMGVTFHDGTPFNASCVKWNIERAMKIFYPDGPVWMVAEPLVGGAAVESVAFSEGPSSTAFVIAFNNWVATSNAIIVLDDHTVRFRLAEPYPAFIAAMTYEVGAMISPSFAIAHASNSAWANWEDYGVDYGEYNNYMASHTCGTGPYMLTNWIPDQYIELDLYTDYWRTSTSEGAGSIEKVYIRTNEDVNGRSFNLRAGTSDMCYWPTSNALEIWDPVAEESLDPDIHVSTGGASYSVVFYGFNMGTLSLANGTIITSPYANRDFRQCSSYAFNYTAFINAAFNGFGMQAKGPIPYGMFGYNATSYSAYYNITEAVEYWNAAVEDPEFLQALDNMDYTITFYYNSGNTAREQGMLLLADGLSLVVAHEDANLTGIEGGVMQFTTQALEWSTYLDYIRLRQVPIFFVGWAPDYADPDNYVYSFCYEWGTYAQRIGYNNSVVNEDYLLARSETNPDIRMSYYNIINDQLAEDAPYLWTYQATEFRTWRTWLDGDGLVYNPMHGEYFYHMSKMIIDTTPPQIDNPANVLYDEFATGYAVTWHPTDLNPQSYIIYLDGTPVKSGAWNSSSEVITIPVDGLSVGTYNYTLVVTDIVENTASDEVMVTVVDATYPTINTPVDIEYMEFTAGHSITWHPTDFNPQSYIIYLDGTPVKSGAWNSSSEVITISIDGLVLGTYNYTLAVTDVNENTATDEVLVTVIDATYPTINTPADIEYVEFTTGHSITWHPSDVHPASYIVYRDGAPIMSGTWNSSSEFIWVSVDGLTLGTYQYILSVTDQGGNPAVDSVTVTVVEATTTSTTTSTTTTLTNGTVTSPDGMTIITIVLSVGGGIIIIIVIILLLKKRGK